MDVSYLIALILLCITSSVSCEDYPDFKLVAGVKWEDFQRKVDLMHASLRWQNGDEDVRDVDSADVSGLMQDPGMHNVNSHESHSVTGGEAHKQQLLENISRNQAEQLEENMNWEQAEQDRLGKGMNGDQTEKLQLGEGMNGDQTEKQQLGEGLNGDQTELVGSKEVGEISSDDDTMLSQAEKNVNIFVMRHNENSHHGDNKNKTDDDSAEVNNAISWSRCKSAMCRYNQVVQQILGELNQARQQMHSPRQREINPDKLFKRNPGYYSQGQYKRSPGYYTVNQVAAKQNPSAPLKELYMLNKLGKGMMFNKRSTNRIRKRRFVPDVEQVTASPVSTTTTSAAPPITSPDPITTTNKNNKTTTPAAANPAKEEGATVPTTTTSYADYAIELVLLLIPGMLIVILLLIFMTRSVSESPPVEKMSKEELDQVMKRCEEVLQV